MSINHHCCKKAHPCEQQAVQEAEAASSAKIENVTVGIAGQHIRSLQHSDYITRSNSEMVIDEDDIERLINQATGKANIR